MSEIDQAPLTPGGAEQAGREGLREQQLVRLDGSTLVVALEPWAQIAGPCASRVRRLPDGPWLVLAYFPEGWPGPSGPFPAGAEIGAGRQALAWAPPP